MSLWPAVVDHVRDSGAEMLSSLFDGAKPLEVDDEKSVLRVGFPASATFNKRKAEARANVEKIAASVSAIIGIPLRPVYELLDTDPEPEEAAAIGDEELIELIKTKFDASELTDDGPPQAEAQ
jgi:hypothetical protein